MKELIEKVRNMALPPKLVFSGTTCPKDLRELLKKELKEYT